MNARSKNIGSDLNKVDAHTLQSEEYNEIPELDDAFFERADLYEGEKMICAGRPKSDIHKILLSVRYSPEVVEYFRSTGKGWQTRMDDALKDWLKTHSVM